MHQMPGSSEDGKQAPQLDSRIRRGLAAAWTASVATAFIAGCVYALFLDDGYVPGYPEATGLGTWDRWVTSFFVGGVTAALAAVISALTLVFMWWPLYRYLVKRGQASRSIIVSAGVLVSLFWIAVVVAGQYGSELRLPQEHVFEAVAILFSGVMASMTFWWVIRPDLHGARETRADTDR